ncbi:hypothetical protein BDW69DRAFT_180307 [Aspergillus filifer]
MELPQFKDHIRRTSVSICCCWDSLLYLLTQGSSSDGGPLTVTGIPTATIVPLNTHREVFAYNRTFGDDTQVDNNTIAARDSIVPVSQGSVHHPSGAKKAHIYTLSVAHQLHCLWSIHQNYYNALHGRTNTKTSGEGDTQHMRHCFHYMRQSLMCASDTTLEPVDGHLAVLQVGSTSGLVATMLRCGGGRRSGGSAMSGGFSSGHRGMYK